MLKLNRVFFFFSNSSGSIPAMRVIKSSSAPRLLISFSIPLKRLIPLPPPNSLLMAAADASKPLVTPTWFLRISLSFFKTSSRDEAAGPLPPPVFSSSTSSSTAFVASIVASVTETDFATANSSNIFFAFPGSVSHSLYAFCISGSPLSCMVLVNTDI